ncbi:MAG: glycoside hydrolase family 25 protein [Tepidisphaeraceae bacterium]
MDCDRRQRARAQVFGVDRLEERRMLVRSLGIDVSSYQTSINWTSVKSAGIDFAYVKATEGATYDSPTFTTQMNGATAAGVLAGAYHFARYDNNSASTEASHFLSVAGSYMANGYLRPVVDVEVSTTLTKAQVSAWVNTFSNAILAAKGVRPLVYTGVSYASTKLDSTVTQWDNWMANYPASPNPQTGAPSGTTPWSGWKIWQYTQTGTVSGISGNVDRDVFNGDLAAMQSSLKINLNPTFTPGQTIQVSGTSSGLKAWDTSASNGTYVVEPEGAIGTIVSGPVNAAGYDRWEIRWQGESVTRWSAAPWLAPVTTAPSAVSATSPTNGQSFYNTALPTTLDWSDSTVATSYDVYLDNVLQANTYTSTWTTGTAFTYGPHTWKVVAKNSVGTATSSTFNFYIGKFVPGDSVKVVNAPSGLKAWDTAASNGTYVLKANGTTATVMSGPVFANGYWRWELRYAGDTVNRWSAEDYLAFV